MALLTVGFSRAPARLSSTPLGPQRTQLQVRADSKLSMSQIPHQPQLFASRQSLQRALRPSHAQHNTAGQNRRQVTTTAAAEIQAYVWGAPDGKRPWACPFCHSLLLMIDEKTLQYDRNYVDYSNKPDWFDKENPHGKMPLIKDESNGKHIGGLDAILNYLEDKYSEPSIGKLSQDKSPSTIPETDVQGLWQAYKAFAQAIANNVENEGDVRAPFEQKLEEVADALKENGGKFFGKDYVDATDLVLGPQLNHMSVVLKHLNSEWAFPADSGVLDNYIETIRGLPSWKVTQYSDDDVISYWEKVIKPAGK